MHVILTFWSFFVLICASSSINFAAISYLPSECGIFQISETGDIVVGESKLWRTDEAGLSDVTSVTH